MKKLILAEKPSVGKEIARVLGCPPKDRSYCEGKDYIVTWAMGHLVELAEPTAYDPRFQKWDLNLLPMLPERMKHQIIRKTSNQFRQIKSLVHRKLIKQFSDDSKETVTLMDMIKIKEDRRRK